MVLKALAFNGITILVTFAVAFLVAGLIKVIAVVIQRKATTNKE